MKKIVILITLMAMLFSLVGCDVNEEWISPDGVHYWMHGYGMSPRYDHDGNLVIDRSDNE